MREDEAMRTGHWEGRVHHCTAGTSGLQHLQQEFVQRYSALLKWSIHIFPIYTTGLSFILQLKSTYWLYKNIEVQWFGTTRFFGIGSSGMA
jgi:hypothetical protein